MKQTKKQLKTELKSLYGVMAKAIGTKGITQDEIDVIQSKIDKVEKDLGK